jgi:Flp pilus assembly protein TadB
MKSPEEREQELQRIEKQLREKETELRLRELESQITQEKAQFYQTSKVNSQEKGKLWQGQAILGLKLFGLAVVAIIAVKVASFAASAVIVGTLVFVGYKLFFGSKK